MPSSPRCAALPLPAQKGRSLLAGIEAYTAVISQAIGEALTLVPADGLAVQERQGAKRGLILFCAEQGFAGAFSERVFEAAGADIDGAVNLIVGTRVPPSLASAA